ncbi:MAG: response regulator [Candidatus Omnitrophota bacterium]
MAEKQVMNILIVDDEKVVRDFLSRLLSFKDIIPKTAESGLEAIEMMKKEIFDFVFLDVRMPGMDGVQALKELKKINSGAKYVMMTGYSVDDLLEEAKKEDIFASIKKPFDVNQIITFVIKQAQERHAEKVSIMVIDDDKNILDFFKRLLTDNIYNLHLFSSADSALEKLKKQDFDLIFLDVFLGEVNGIELYSRIREIRPKAQVVFITGNFENIKDDIKKLDVQGCLFKPFEIDKIFSEIDKVKNVKQENKYGDA